MPPLNQELKKFGKVKTNALLAKYSTFKIGGPAYFLLTVTDNENLVGALNFLTGAGMDYFLLGGGSNVLFPDDGFRGVVIVNKTSSLSVEGNTIQADAGVPLSRVVEATNQASLAGFEWAAGIPGTVGGAVRGNAGARYAFVGGELKDCLKTVSVWRDGEVVESSNQECVFGYRDSIFKHEPAVVLSMQITLSPGLQSEIVSKTQNVIAERRSKHASEPSAGSFFKNIFLSEWKKDPALLPPRFLEYKKIAAGWLIDQAGCKGLRVGDAQISPSHGNFIINLGGATQADVLAVRDEVCNRVNEKFGVNLEEEVMVVA